MILIFWLSIFGIFYAYFGYPLLLAILVKLIAQPVSIRNRNYTPRISVLVPVHNEIAVIESKLENTLALEYPVECVEFLFISDGSMDGTNELIMEYESDSIKLIKVIERKGKANALNIGLSKASHDIIVFSDASILLEKEALKEIVNPFQDRQIGCVSGEDHIKESGGEGLYGQYELWLRNLESKVYSVVGASGSFYAQRKDLCENFGEGLAPDFLSVMNTVEAGYRAITEPRAIGYMTSVKSTGDEFNRKVRTLVRGMSALFVKRKLLNPLKYGFFTVELISHKLFRWLVPMFLITAFVSNTYLSGSNFYFLVFWMQITFYTLAILAFYKVVSLQKSIIGKVALYFTMVNISIFIAWIRYFCGIRQEVWSPSKRES